MSKPRPKGQFLRLHRALWFERSALCIFWNVCRRLKLEGWPKIESHEKKSEQQIIVIVCITQRAKIIRRKVPNVCFIKCRLALDLKKKNFSHHFPIFQGTICPFSTQQPCSVLHISTIGQYLKGINSYNKECRNIRLHEIAHYYLSTTLLSRTDCFRQTNCCCFSGLQCSLNRLK